MAPDQLTFSFVDSVNIHDVCLGELKRL
jgi:hypothetical protein